MNPRILLCALAGLTCSPEPTVVALELVEDASCAAEQLAEIASVSVEVYGDADGELCTIARRCVAVDVPAELADVEAALRDASQPLIDVELGGTRQIAVLGHRRLGCGEGDRTLCGFAELADVEADALQIPIHCDASPDQARCPIAVPPFCP